LSGRINDGSGKASAVCANGVQPARPVRFSTVLFHERLTHIMNSSLDLYSNLFDELERWQQRVNQAFRPGGGNSIRASAYRSFPALSVGSTPEAIEVLALAPGVQPDALKITIDKGLLVIAGERQDDEADTVGDKTTVYAHERFKGGFRRVISLPDDIDPARISASCKDGLLRVSVARREASRPRQITVN
jgi:HSP20 family protein